MQKDNLAVFCAKFGNKSTHLVGFPKRPNHFLAEFCTNVAWKMKGLYRKKQLGHRSLNCFFIKCGLKMFFLAWIDKKMEKLTIKLKMDPKDSAKAFSWARSLTNFTQIQKKVLKTYLTKVVFTFLLQSFDGNWHLFAKLFTF